MHDYLTQRGGAERAVLAMIKALPGVPVYTSLYEPSSTFPEFSSCDVRTGAVDRVGFLRRHHRMAFPLLAPAFSRLHVDAQVLLCSSSGWAHGAGGSGAKVVYCYTPARWLYQPQRYLGTSRRPLTRVALATLAPPLRRWDRASAATAQRYLAISTVVRDRIRACYGIDAEILHPPSLLGAAGPRAPVSGLSGGHLLCVSRLLPYKNVSLLVSAMAALPGNQLVIVGTGPDEPALRASAPSNVRLLGTVDDDSLRWLYASCSAVVAPSYEDFGLVPLEAASFGKPTVALRSGGFLDTVVEGQTGLFFDLAEREAVVAGIRQVAGVEWSETAIRRVSERFGEARFSQRLSEIVAEESRRI
ncbi:MAG: glycosyltransferase [Acidimicrobiales bacterium]